VRAVLIAMLVFLPLSTVTLYVFACGIGLLWLGTVPLTNGLVGQIFGMRYAGDAGVDRVLRAQIAASSGSGLAGYLYDTTGSYSGAFLAVDRARRIRRDRQPAGQRNPARRAQGRPRAGLMDPAKKDWVTAPA